MTETIPSGGFGRAMYENTLAGLVSLAVALGALAPVACTRADSAASGEAALEDSASNRGIVNQVSFVAA